MHTVATYYDTGKGKSGIQTAQSHTSLDTEVRSYMPAKHRLVSLLAAAGYDELAHSVADCCTKFRALVCGNGHVFNPIPTHRCWYRLCPDCARRRQKRAFARVYPRFAELKKRHPRDRLVLLTLTIKSSHDTLRTVVRLFKCWFANLRRSVAWKERIRAAVAGFEVTYNRENGWHFHVHVLALRKAWWAQHALAEQWFQITGGHGQVVDIREVRGLKGGLREVLKYVHKPADLEEWTPEQITQFNQLSRVKFSETYGALRGLRVEDDVDLASGGDMRELRACDPCPECGGVLALVGLSRELLIEILDSS